MAFFSTLFGQSPAAPAPEPARADAAPTMTPEQQRIFDFKTEALEAARAKATDQGRAPTLDDYFVAAHHIGKSNNLSPDQWNPKVYADLSYQKIDGFQINKSDIEPGNTRMAQLLQDEGAQGKSGVDVMKHEMDLDGKHLVAGFYDDIDKHLRFDKTKFSNVSFHPATTYNVEKAPGAEFNNVTFDGMKDGDKFTFGQGSYNHVKMTNINGGEIAFDGSHVHGLDMHDAKVATISLGAHTSISNLNAKGADIVTLNAEPGAEINHANFDHATIGMESKLEGLKLSNAHFVGSNLHGVDFHGVTLNKVEFKDVAGLDLDGATLGKDGVKINGVQFNSMDKVAAFQNSLAALHPDQRQTLATLGAGMGTPEKSPFEGLVAAAKLSNGISSGITGGDHASEATLSTAVASQKRTVAEEHQASPANMAAITQRMNAAHA